MIGVFHKIHGILNCARSHVHCIEWLSPNLLGPLKIFVMSHFIGYVLMPCGIKCDLPVFSGTYGSLPLPCGTEVTSGKSHGRKSRSLKSINKVGPEALIVGGGVLRIIHCPVYYGSYGFEESRK